MEKKKKLKLFKTVTVIVLVVILLYFTLSISYTAKNPANASPVMNQLSDEKTVFVKAKAEGDTGQQVIAYTVIVGNSGTYVTIPHSGKIIGITYDKSVINVAVSHLTNGTLFEIMPKSYFTQTVIRVKFADGETAVINAVGEFTPEVSIITSNTSINGIVGDTKTVDITLYNYGISPVVADLKINATPNILVEPKTEDIYLPSGDREVITLKIKLKEEGYGVVTITCCGETATITVDAKPPFKVLNYTKTTTPGSVITATIDVVKPGKITATYNREVVFSENLTAGKHVLEFTNPEDTPNILLPITFSEGNYNKTIIVFVSGEQKPTSPELAVTPIGKMAYSPGVYEVVIRNPSDKPVNVNVSVEAPEGINVTYENHTIIPASGIKILSFKLSTMKVFLKPEEMLIRLSYNGVEKEIVVIVSPKTTPSINVSVVPVTTSNGIVNVRIELKPNIPINNATVDYRVIALHDGSFIPVAGSKVDIPTLTDTEIVLRNFPPASVVIVEVKVYSDGVLLKDFSKTLVFKAISG